MRLNLFVSLVVALVLVASAEVARGAGKTPAKAAPAASSKQSQAQSAAPATASSPPQGVMDDAIVTSRTKFDFSEALIEGQMAAPEGFFLQGRNAQALSQMVQLRSHFKSELRTSKAGVKALSK
jgi:hypothetical protein